MRIYVTGGLSVSRHADAASVRALGAAITAAGHTLLQGYYNAFDRLIAEAAYAAANDSGQFSDPRLSVHSFVTKDAALPSNVPWVVRRLRIRDWDPGEERWTVPEPIQSCDVAIVLGGGPKTLRAANLCRLAGKPLLPITAIGGAAAEVFETELGRFGDVYEGRISRDQFSLLDRQSATDFSTIAEDAIRLASRLAMGSSVFVIMAFRDELIDTFSTISAVCKERGLTCIRTDQDPTTDRIYKRIVGGIRSASFVVADVTIPTPNVYYELGFAEALGKPIIVVAKDDATLHFDTQDIPTTLFKNQTGLKESLGKRVNAILGLTK